MDGSGSNNHVFLGDGAAWMMQYLAGIRHDPDHPGFQRFIIKPHVAGDLTWVNAHHDSPYGRIESAWTRDGDTFTLNLTVPPNSTATVLLPDQSDAILLQSGRHTVECKLG
jgi:alpha-L-rhamnosidase